MPDSIPWPPERALENPKGPEVRVWFDFQILSFHSFKKQGEDFELGVFF